MSYFNRRRSNWQPYGSLTEIYELHTGKGIYLEMLFYQITMLNGYDVSWRLRHRLL